MTIDELLELAQQYVGYAVSGDAAGGVPTATLQTYTAIAQAAAQTAQAMILYAASHKSVGESRVIDVGMFQQ